MLMETTVLLPTVLLVEDHTLVRTGIRALLDASSEVNVVGEAADGRGALEPWEALHPDVVLTDVEMRDLNGIEAARQIHLAYPNTKSIMLSMYGEPQYVRESLRAGASGYGLKDAAFKELLAAIHAVLEGKRFLSPQVADVVMDDYAKRGDDPQPASELDKLSPREREILQLVAEGHSSAQIARMLTISVRTVDTH